MNGIALDHETILGQKWGGTHTCGQQIEMLWVSPTLSAMQDLPPILHMDITGAEYTPRGHLRCEGCGCLLIERPDGQPPVEADLPPWAPTEEEKEEAYE